MISSESHDHPATFDSRVIRSLIHDLEFGIQELDHELDEFSPVFDLADLRSFDLVEGLAVGAALQGLYTGLEKTLLVASERLIGKLEKGDKWHEELMLRCKITVGSLPPLLSDSSIEKLRVYKNFRHVFRASNASRVAPERVQDLLRGFKPVWVAVKRDLVGFLEASRELEKKSPIGS